MRNLALSCEIVAALVVLLGLQIAAPARAAGAPAPASPLAGDWLGELTIGGARTLVRLILDTVAGRWTAVVTVPTMGVERGSGEGVSAEGDTVRFAVPTPGGKLQFEAKLVGGELVGTAGTQEARGALRLVRLGKLESPERLFGIYEAAGCRRFWIGTFSELGTDPFWLDFESGRFGPVYPAPDGTLFLGTGLSLPLPGEIRITPELRLRGDAAAIRVRTGATAEVRALRVPLVREEVNFRNGDVTLAGTVTRPPTPGRRAAVILVHGSGPLDRTWFSLWADFFAAQGVVALAYDKRGTGASTGDWKTSDFEALAGDATAGLDLLASLPSVDPRRVGLWGVSQGGWIGPLIASRRPSLAFLILHAGPATTVAQQTRDNWEGELRAAGLGDEDVRLALGVVELSQAYDRNPSDAAWARLEAADAAARAAGAVWLPPFEPRDSWFRPFYRKLLDFDPKPVLEKTTCPVLAFFGTLDANVPAEKNRALMASALATAGNRDVTLVVLPNTNHYLMRCATGSRDEIPSLREFEPEYFRKMAEWLRVRSLTERSTKRRVAAESQ